MKAVLDVCPWELTDIDVENACHGVRSTIDANCFYF